MANYKVYGDIKSGNCYKIKLLMSLLNIEHEWLHIDILAGESQTAEFKTRNSLGKIPVLETRDGEFLSESNAILNFIAEGTDYLPSNGLARAKILQWQFFEQYSHEPYIAVARYINTYLGLPDDRKDEFHSKQKGGHAALSAMEEQLKKTPFLTGDRFSIADISLYAYTHVAHEGGFDLLHYPFIIAWCKRITELPGFYAMP